MRRPFRFAVGILLPAVLILAGILVLTGCLFIPTFNTTLHGTNVAAKVGDAKSSRPIRVGFATREQIIATFGKPPYMDDTGMRIGYAWTVKNGVWIYPFCFTGRDQIGNRGIELDFDEHGVLEDFHVVAADGQAMLIMDLGVRDPHFPRRPPFDQSLHPNDDDLRNRWRRSF
jgi:hypothetical protein